MRKQRLACGSCCCPGGSRCWTSGAPSSPKSTRKPLTRFLLNLFLFLLFNVSTSSKIKGGFSLVFIIFNFFANILQDAWNLLLEFIEQIRPDFSNYDSDGLFVSVIVCVCVRLLKKLGSKMWERIEDVCMCVYACLGVFVVCMYIWCVRMMCVCSVCYLIILYFLQVPGQPSSTNLSLT